MEIEKLKETIRIIGKEIGLDIEKSHWTGIDCFLPFLQKMRLDGAVVVIKFDGERINEGDNGPYTIIVSGQVLGDEFIRIDSHSLEHALIYVIAEYGRKYWL